jgi:hypothetical protein
LIAESQDSFTIADDVALHVVVTARIQDPIDTILIRITEKESARLSPYLTKALATLTYSWRGYQR